MGFGLGHNENFKLLDSDFFLILNDDILIPHAKWLNTAFKLFDQDDKLSLIGSDQSPQFIDGSLGLGTSRNINLQNFSDYPQQVPRFPQNNYSMQYGNNYPHATQMMSQMMASRNHQ